MKVYAQLNEARKQFHTLQLKKTGLNKFAGYQYFELCDFLVPALNVFDKNGLCAYISFGKEMATMTIAATEDGSSILLTSPMAEANLKGCHPIQNLGAVETYTRRYLWVAALEIVEHDAIEGDQQSSDGNAAAKKQEPAKPVPCNMHQVTEMAALANEVRADLPALFEWLSKKSGRTVNTFSEITVAEKPHVIKALESKKASA